jgi:hypothetical protein
LRVSLINPSSTACLLFNESASYFYAARLSRQVKPQRKRVLNGRYELHGVDPKPGDLSMARVKFR